MYKTIKVPMNIQFEITSVCNEKCRHCYNYWRSESDSQNAFNMPLYLFDKCMDEIIANDVLHVIFTGGEPFINYDILLRGIQKASAAGLSTSCNSNLLIANKHKLEELHYAGLPHILTSLNSYDEQTNDYIASHNGALKKIINGIENATDAGIKISTNMIITKNNISHIHETVRLSYELGVKKFHVTRVIPPSYIDKRAIDEFDIGHKELQRILDDCKKASDDFPIEIKTLIPYPLCALKDLDQYSNFVGRPCAAGKRSMSIDSRGDAHACWHMVEDFGNVAEVGLLEVWQRMAKWRSGELIPNGCKNCEYLGLCGAGCRLAGHAYSGDLSADDNLRVGWEEISSLYTGNVGVDDVVAPFSDIFKMYKGSQTPELNGSLRNDLYAIESGLRIRDEQGFCIVNLVAGTSFFLEEKYAAIVKELRNNSPFKPSGYNNDLIDFFAYLAIKGVIKKISN